MPTDKRVERVYIMYSRADAHIFTVALQVLATH